MNDLRNTIAHIFKHKLTPKFVDIIFACAILPSQFNIGGIRYETG